MQDTDKDRLKSLPKIDKLLDLKIFQGLNRNILKIICQREINNVRKSILDNQDICTNIEKIAQNILYKYKKTIQPSLKSVINATGVILHTNLGRCTINKAILEQASFVMSNYANIEYDMQIGTRGSRYAHLSNLIRSYLGFEDVLVVNNNAAAVFLILNTFAYNKEAIISRGELIEIGGNFRIPDVMMKSGAILKEVGTTNKTKLQDYKSAISANTAMILKVHKSNFSIQGFEEETKISDMINLAHKNNIIDYYDIGSGFVDETLNIKGEIGLFEISKLKVSLISFSGDKLLGGVQSGIICGKKSLIDKLKTNQLLRMLRVDKYTMALLECTFRAYINKEYDKIDALTLINACLDEQKQKAQVLSANIIYDTHIKQSTTYIGGGSCANHVLDTYLVILDIDLSEEYIHKALLSKGIVARIETKRVVLDVRSIKKEDIKPLAKIINSLRFGA